MPNWTTLKITLKHEDKAKVDLIANIDLAKKGVLQTLIPCPEELNNNELTSWGHGPEEEAREVLRKQMFEKYGYKSWYDWNIAHWGTKWDLCDAVINRVDDNTVVIDCQTAWSPPDEAFATLVGMGYDVRALYVGEGYEFAGIWDNGQDEYYQDFGDSQGARATLPQELDDEFDISAGMEEYEREEMEDVQRFVVEGAAAREQMGEPQD